MAWNKDAMDATFLLSNVAPMKEEFNDGIWLELEHNIRDWSRRYKSIKVVTGPVFDNPITTIGENEIMVPRYFYKAAFTVKDGSPMVIGFIMNQDQKTFGPLEDYIVSIDSIENVTGLDLFSNLYGDWDEEIRLEKEIINPSREWPLNEKWYQQRLEEERREGRN
jgi:endonuclease G